MAYIRRAKPLDTVASTQWGRGFYGTWFTAGNSATAKIIRHFRMISAPLQLLLSVRHPELVPPPPHYHRGGGALDSSSVINGDHLDCCAVDEEPIDSPVTLAAILGGFPSTHDYYLFSCLYIIIIVSVYLANLALFCVRVLFLHKLV